jgi:hypothetical protein
MGDLSDKVRRSGAHRFGGATVRQLEAVALGSGGRQRGGGAAALEGCRGGEGQNHLTKNCSKVALTD